MGKYQPAAWRGKCLFVGLDIHRKRWHVTVRTEDDIEIFCDSIAGDWECLKRLLQKYRGCRRVLAVYEAGFSGFWLYDCLEAFGVEAVVTPPNKIPKASGDRVKTDRVDSRRLAKLLQAGLLKSVWVPDMEQRSHREVVRRRWQLRRDGVRIKNQIKAVLRCYGLEVPGGESSGRWSHRFVEALWAMEFPDPYFQKSFRAHLERLDATVQIQEALKLLLHELARSDKYRARVELLESIPGVGWLTAIELLLELPPMVEFGRANQLPAYIGLTPSQFSTGDLIRMGYITRQGRGGVRALLVEAAWRLIKKDPAMTRKYDELKARAGSKRAVVAIARRLLIRIRRILLDQTPYLYSIDPEPDR